MTDTQQAAISEPGEIPQDWIFTFGPEHTYAGASLGDQFVRVHGSFLHARLAVIGFFGRAWCSQYESEADAGVREYRLTEVVIPELPISEAKAAEILTALEGVPA